MSKRIDNIPSPDILMNSMRSMGYSFKTAIADIIDNSISAYAKNVEIYFSISQEENQYVAILDDGYGMTNQELLNAMRYGSVKDNYGPKDLGRFGLGLKSASLSQCRLLTVVSKKNNILSCYQWDLDDVLLTKKWQCIELEKDEIDKIMFVDKLNNQESGTLVLWQNFDIAYKKTDGHVNMFLSDEMFEAEKHIRLIYHRFLNARNQLRISINNDYLKGYDPFLEEYQKNPKVDCKQPSELGYGVIMQQYTLPHQVDLSNEDIDALGGIEAMKDQQGFFIYRNNRLIIHSTWFKLTSKNINPELYKYGRIKVDIPNTLDDMWEIDIKKQNAVIPRMIINMLKRSVSLVCEKSKSKTTKRARLDYEVDDNHLWSKSITRDNKDVYAINENSKFIKNFIDAFDDKDRSKIIRLLDIISASIPYDDIYNSVCNKNQNVEIETEKFDSIIILAMEQIEMVKNVCQIDLEMAINRVTEYEPFNDENIINEIRRRLLNGQC